MTPPRELPEAVQLARVAMQTRGAAGAKETVEQLATQHPDLDDLQAMRALIAFSTAERDRAQAIVRERIASGPGVGTLAAAARLAARLGSYTRYQEFIGQAQAVDPDHFLVLAVRLLEATWVGDNGDAAAAADRSLMLYPCDPEVLCAKIAIFVNCERFQEAGALLGSPPDWFRGTSQHHFALGLRAYRRKHVRTAEAEFRASADLIPMSAPAWAHLAVALRFMERYDESEVAARTALSLDPNHPLALRTLAQIAVQRGAVAAAEDYRRRADDANPRARDGAVLGQAARLHDAGDKRAGIELLRGAIRSATPRTQQAARRLLVSTLITDGLWAEAATELEAAVAAGCQGGGLRVARIRLLEHQGRIGEALSHCREMLSEPIPYAAVYGPAISVCIASGRTAEADKLLNDVKTTLPGYPSDLASVVLALNRHKRIQAARGLLDAAMQHYPVNAQLKAIDDAYRKVDRQLRRKRAAAAPEARARRSLWPILLRGLIRAILDRY